MPFGYKSVATNEGGYRPVLVIENNRGNQYSPTVIVAAITSKPKSKLLTHVAIPANIQGLEQDSVVLLEQLRTLDKKRLNDYVGTLDRQQMLKVDKALCSSTGLGKMDKPILMCLCLVCVEPFYDADDIQKLLGIGRSKVYAFLDEAYERQKPFRVIKIGKLYRVLKEGFQGRDRATWNLI